MPLSRVVLRPLIESRPGSRRSGQRVTGGGPGRVELPMPLKTSPGEVLGILIFRKEANMARKRFTAEQIIIKLREAEVDLAQGKTVGQVSKQIGVTEQTYYRWRKE